MITPEHLALRNQRVQDERMALYKQRFEDDMSVNYRDLWAYIQAKLANQGENIF